MEQEPLTEPASSAPTSRVRYAVAAIVALAALGYFVGVVAGKLPARLAPADLGVFALTALTVGGLLRPDIFERLTHLKFGGFEVQLRELERKQAEHSQQLEDIRLALVLAVDEKERRHLRNLEQGTTQNYDATGVVRAELRKLRAAGLVSNKGKRIEDVRGKVDLKEFVELTKRGRLYLARLGKEPEDIDR
jgi:hypothetical protein